MDKRSTALDGDLPFGALRLPPVIENFRATTNRLSGDALSRRVVSLARRACLLGRSDPIDVDVFEHCRARLYPRSNRCEKRVFLGVNSWDFPERAAITQALMASPSKRPFVFVDGGANVGLYSLFVASEARRLGRAARIVAIEPDPTNLGRLRFNVSASGASEIHVAPYALGDRSQTGRLLSVQGNRGEVRLARGDETVDGAVEVPVKTFRDVLEETGIDYVDCMKLDIEGAEYPALSGLFSGGQETIWPSMIILEVGRGKPSSEAYRLCAGKGYSLIRQTPMNVILHRSRQTGGGAETMEHGA